MLSASSIMYKKISVLGLVMMLAITLHAQTENSPYSRYGLGDELPSQNIMSRGIGGVSAAYADILSVNFSNPASYAKLKRATFDFGLEVDSRTLKVIDPPRKFSSASPIISYVQLGFPLSQKRAWGMNIGLRPVTRINYMIDRNERLQEIDSVNTSFEGSGGSYEVYTGTGFAFKNLSLGFNVGYLFGTKNYSTKRNFIPDSAYVFYYGSEYASNSSFGGIFGNAGMQYTIRLNKKNIVRLGAYGSLKREYSASRDNKVQTYQVTVSGIDSVDLVQQTSESGKVVYPANYGAGIMFYGEDRWLFGADITQTKWSDYRFFGDKDLVQDSWKLHVGGQILPNILTAKTYWGRVTYRAGFSYGKDYVKVPNDLPTWGLSLGFGFPMRPPSYTNQYSIINTSIEFGQRGNNTNIIRENYFRVSFGLTLSDIWFIKRKYD
jgi:hypothetical protein